LSHPPPKWMLEQITTDLQTYRERVLSTQLLDEGFYGKEFECHKLIRFRIQDRILSVATNECLRKSKHADELIIALKKLNDLVSLPDVDFIVSLQDGFSRDDSLPFCPWFVFAKSFDNEKHILIPDLMALRGYPNVREEIEQASRTYPWSSKIEKIFWRGATTGGSLTTHTWADLPRSRLVLFSLKHPEIIDARFNRVVQAAPGVKEILQSRGMMAKTVRRADHLRYKYLIDVDGNTSTFERFFWQLFSNSLIFKQNSPNRQWYYAGLQANQHFLPVKEDLSDLMEQILWAKRHDYEAQQIAEQASDFVRHHLTNEDHFLYLTLLLREYAALWKKSQSEER
jgi:hypothetical protein